MSSLGMSTGRKVAIAIGSILGAFLLFACGYVGFVAASIYRIGDASLDVEGDALHGTAQTGTTYSIVSFNLGFGAYSQDYSCMVDTGYAQDSSGEWKLVSGKHFKGLSVEDVKANTEGAIETLDSLSTDFVLTQETDTSSDRSYNINQKELFQDAFDEYSSTFAINNHTPFIAYPLTDMEGYVNSGLLTLSRYAIQSGDRYELDVADDFLSMVYDLDRCFSASYINVNNGKQLVLVNVHMSTYESGDSVRNTQREQLYSFISKEYAKGNYVVVGGDFNHDLLTNNPDFPEYSADNLPFSDMYTEKPKDRVTWFDESGSAELPDGFTLTASDNCPSLRNAALEWTEGFNQVFTVDGFITSDNIRVVSHKNIETSTDEQDGFAYSDHEPAYMEFELE